MNFLRSFGIAFIILGVVLFILGIVFGYLRGWSQIWVILLMVFGLLFVIAGIVMLVFDHGRIKPEKENCCPLKQNLYQQ